MKFNENLKYLRKQANLTQEQLAEKLNVSRQAITKWESGQSLPDIENLKELAYIFSVSVDSLVGDVECKSTNKIEKKINDIGYFIFASIMSIGAIVLAIGNLIRNITQNEDIVVASYILMTIMGFIIFVLEVKLYLKDTKNVIINMKATEDGKKERVRRVLKKSISELIALAIFDVLITIDELSFGVWYFTKSVFSGLIIIVLLVSVLGIIEYLNMEKKVKELNKE